MAPGVISDEKDASVNGKSHVENAGDNGVADLLKYGNPSLQVTADHRIKMQEAPIQEPGPGEVLLHIKCTGICGSDIHFWHRGAIGTLTVDGDCILGHEASGVVLRAHPSVTHLRPGDRVAVEPGVPCEACFLCAAGRYNLCAGVAFAGVYPHAGTLQRFKTHPAKWVHKLPPAVSFAEAALLEPLSVVLHGIRTAPLALGKPALVCGAGPIGLLALRAARASGAHPLVVTDLEPRRLEFARRYVPGCLTYRIDTKVGARENAERIRKLYLGEEEEGEEGAERGEDGERVLKEEDEYKMPDTVLECTGVESSVCTAGFVARRGGTVCVIGVGKDTMNNLPFMHMSLAEINLKFINRYRDTWPAGIQAISGGVIDVKPLVSHVFPLEKAEEAMHLCADVTQGSIKVQIEDKVDIPVRRSGNSRL